MPTFKLFSTVIVLNKLYSFQKLVCGYLKFNYYN